MNPKTLARLAGVLGVLAAATLIAALLTRPPRVQIFAPEGFADKATRLEIETAKGKLELKREKGVWTASAPTGYPADGKAVNELLGKLPQSTVSSSLTEDPQRYALFGFEASNTTHVRLYSGEAEPTLDFFVGKDGADYPSSFVRLAKQGGIVQVSGVSASQWSRPAGDWLAKTITSGMAESVTALSVRGAKGSWELKQSSGGWLLGGKALPQETVDGLVRQVREAAGNLEADSVLDAAAAPKDTGLEKPELRVEVLTHTGPISFAVGKKDDSGRCYVQKIGESRVLFLVGDWKLDALRKSAADFQVKPRKTR